MQPAWPPPSAQPGDKHTSQLQLAGTYLVTPQQGLSAQQHTGKFRLQGRREFGNKFE